ncbi:MAG: PaaI family thioesterase [Candidatus Limnocylindrales bacterium]
MTSEARTQADRTQADRGRSDRQVAAAPGGPAYEFEPHNCFACGELNEHGLRLKLHLGERRSWADFVLDARFEGWTGMTHGGIIATILDEVMAWALVAEDNWGVTARMSLVFKHPVPVGTRVRGEGWITASRRRLVETAGQVVDAQGTVLATAEAVYLAANEERRRELMAQYGIRIQNARATGEGISK